MAAMLLDAFRHNSWATAELLGYCRGLDDATLRATVPGTYGSIIDTLAHTINSEASYLSRLAGAWPGYPWPEADAPESRPIDACRRMPRRRDCAGMDSPSRPPLPPLTPSPTQTRHAAQ